jgi:hypothetical protein
LDKQPLRGIQAAHKQEIDIQNNTLNECITSCINGCLITCSHNHQRARLAHTVATLPDCLHPRTKHRTHTALEPHHTATTQRCNHTTLQPHNAATTPHCHTENRIKPFFAPRECGWASCCIAVRYHCLAALQQCTSALPTPSSHPQYTQYQDTAALLPFQGSLNHRAASTTQETNQ